MHWRLVFRKYTIFFLACCGYWTDETVDAYALEETAKVVFVDDDTEANYTKLLYISVGIRAIVFQIFDLSTFLSVLIGSLSATPLFVYSKRLNDCLPPLLVWNAWERAWDKEATISGDQLVLNSQWCVYLRTISIWMNESRVVVFLSNILILCLSFATVIYAETKNKYAVLAIVLMNLPFAWGHALVAVMFVGKSLELYDNDFLVTYYGLLKFLTLGFYHVDKHALTKDQNREEAFKEKIEQDGNSEFNNNVFNNMDDDIAIEEWKLFMTIQNEEDEYSSFSSSSSSSSRKSSSSSAYRNESHGDSIPTDSLDEGNDSSYESNEPEELSDGA
jgi:hypothetical protein